MLMSTIRRICLLLLKLQQFKISKMKTHPPIFYGPCEHILKFYLSAIRISSTLYCVGREWINDVKLLVFIRDIEYIHRSSYYILVTKAHTLKSHLAQKVSWEFRLDQSFRSSYFRHLCIVRKSGLDPENVGTRNSKNGAVSPAHIN